MASRAMSLWVLALALILGTADSFTADVKLNAADTATNSVFSSGLAMSAPIGGSTYLVAGQLRPRINLTHSTPSVHQASVPPK